MTKLYSSGKHSCKNFDNYDYYYYFFRFTPKEVICAAD